MSDLIDRQAAIKAIDDLPNCYNGYSDTYDKAYIIGVLEELPSVDVPNTNIGDMISRQAAIDAVLHHGEIENNYTDLYHDGYCDGVYDSADMLKDLPPAEPAEPRIIRCKDCKHWTDKNAGLCDIWDHYISNEAFFCGCGERKENDEH